MPSLPIDTILPKLRNAFQRRRNIVLSAEPGAGKTTRVPLALLNEPWLNGKKIIMLEPRRLAATRSAAFMAEQIHEKVGDTIGYRIRGDNRTCKSTKIEVVTEGILTRFLQNDPLLPDVGLIIFDEFHERSIHADLGLALSIDVQENLRNDLRLLVMSATLDGSAIASMLNDAEIIKSEGRSYPVTTRYATGNLNENIEQSAASTIMQALRQTEGDILVFLPGQSEIRRTDSILSETHLPENVSIHKLFGEAPVALQQNALTPAPHGKRKVILSTSIAETSLTIDGVRVVIDSGLARVPRFDTRRGMSGLVTIPVSQSNADQRRGRAGRQAPGVCYRLWTEQKNSELKQFPNPEITATDLAPLVLEFAKWGTPNGSGLKFLNEPPEQHLNQAIDLLKNLGALDLNGKLTNHGAAMLDLGVHPRLAHMLIRSMEFDLGSLACDIAALLEERDFLGNESDIDLYSRWSALSNNKFRDSYSVQRTLNQSKKLKELLNLKETQNNPDKIGFLLALAYPERIAKRREPESNRYQLRSGIGAVLPKKSNLSKEEYLAVADVDGSGNEVKIFLAEPVSENEINNIFSNQIETEDEIKWDGRREMVVSRRIKKLGAIILSETKIDTDSETVRSAMIEGIREMGLDSLPWTPHTNSLRLRSVWLRKQNIEIWDLPNLEDDYLLKTLDSWLMPHLGGITRKQSLSQIDLESIIEGLFTYKQQRELDRLAPTYLILKNKKRISLDYQINAPPVFAVRLQDMLGEKTTPTVCSGKLKVIIHLLSPARRPIAITQDLPSFWKNAYPEVRKQMRGRYPKHRWPEDPTQQS
ncbi:MAG: ATP-dependent helicase HrpB [Ignavibacteriales bacterium]|nr:ATP-dependent helicase HrpB [Ignavibacteriales bacterium]